MINRFLVYFLQDTMVHILSILECCYVTIQVVGPGTRLMLGVPIVLDRQMCYSSSYQPFELNNISEMLTLHQYL